MLFCRWSGAFLWKPPATRITWKSQQLPSHVRDNKIPVSSWKTLDGILFRLLLDGPFSAGLFLPRVSHWRIWQLCNLCRQLVDGLLEKSQIKGSVGKTCKAEFHSFGRESKQMKQCSRCLRPDVVTCFRFLFLRLDSVLGRTFTKQLSLKIVCRHVVFFSTQFVCVRPLNRMLLLLAGPIVVSARFWTWWWAPLGRWPLQLPAYRT